jgi:hypothetical protein
MSVIITISATTDCMVANGTFTVLRDLAIKRLRDAVDVRALQMARAVHWLDLAGMDDQQAHRIAWALDEAMGEYAEARSSDTAAWLASLQILLRETYGSPRSDPREPLPARIPGPSQ